MPTLSRRISALLAIFVVAVAAPAAPVMAQSAGDEQYSDPFESSGGGSGGGTTTRSTPAPSKAPAATPAAPSTAAPAAAAAPTSPTVTELPRTGMDLRPLAAAGLLLMAAGALLVRWSGTARR